MFVEIDCRWVACVFVEQYYMIQYTPGGMQSCAPQELDLLHLIKQLYVCWDHDL